MSEFEVKITRERSEVQEAQRLRFEVFNLEMKKGLESSYGPGLDADEFDPLCDHLIVRDRSTRRVVGTYRLLLGAEAMRRFGFYAEREFDLQNIKRLDGELLELGRSCAHREYRDKTLIPFMWQAIASYVKSHRVQYLFGCASLYTTDPQEVSEFSAFLRARYYAPAELRVQPRPEYAFADRAGEVMINKDSDLFMRLPSLMKGYLRLGALACGPPALDRAFGTTDFFLLLDISRMEREYLQRYGLAEYRVSRAAR
ncbi:MAG: GNAT family N-acetyltransferase [Deltaproteobacteria bacterium]|nr:GNAT family N-acetyltransferase [Deltaproteobacteria bacterium]